MLAVRVGRAPALTRRAEPASTELPLPGGFEVYAVPYGDLWQVAEEVSQYAADVVVLEPAELRAAVIRGLTAVAAPDRAA